ncbi:MAG: hypothetical protein J5705_05820 [Bacteroidaceae bacterium]|nr:hypothetical protein [Bacteroidaceae bacterium]
MKRLLTVLVALALVAGARAQDNMVPFSHISVGAEIGLHGAGVEVAVPIHKHLVLKAGYNISPSKELFISDIAIDTRDLKSAQERYEAEYHYKFQHHFADEAVINAGLKLGVTNYKAMINFYPFMSRKFYVAGGVYYSATDNNDQPLFTLSGQTTTNDWAALQELKEKTGNSDYEIAVKIGDTTYPVVEKDGCGYIQADFKMDPLKYYLGFGSGRCIPNRSIGLQFELGAMIYHNSVLMCQDKEVDLESLGDKFGSDVSEIMDYVEKYPIYPQLTLRLCFRLF